MTVAGRVLGRRGEAVAAAWYAERGWNVVARNWRCADGELDLVCRRGGLVAVVEVKARSSSRFGAPVEAVGPAKRARLRRVAAAWLRAQERPCGRVRFDVVSVGESGVEVIEEAF